MYSTVSIIYPTWEINEDPRVEYEQRLEAVLALYFKQPVSRTTIDEIESVVVLTQRAFLAEYPELAAAHEPRVEFLPDRRINVVAPIVTIEEKIEIDYRARERARMFVEYKVHQKIEDEKRRRREKNMERQHRRLLARHSNRIPLVTRSVWETLTTGQQYAILKDIDYVVRHEVNHAGRVS
jgi:hypothetical protein